jgi:DegV family protein with EDD domain
MKNNIAIVTDSTNDLPPALRQEYGLIVVPLYIIWGKDEYRDGINITHDEFYERLPHDPVLPKTSQPTPQDYLTAYASARSQGADEIVAITISSALSGTYSSATQAAQQVDYPVHVYDSKSTTLSMGLQILAAARAREAGADAAGMVAAADKARQRMTLLVLLDTLEYLHKGGRIGGAQRFLGTALNLKPQVYIDHETGKVEAGERTRTRDKALNAMYESFIKKTAGGRNLHAAVLYTDARKEAEALAARLNAEHHPVELFVANASPVLGVYTGPGTLGMAGYSDD